METIGMDFEISNQFLKPAHSRAMRKSYTIVDKTPIQVLYEIFGGDVEILVSDLPKFFVASALLDGIKFQGLGSSKNLAKRNLASKALYQLRGVTPLSNEEPFFSVPDGHFLGGFENVLGEIIMKNLDGTGPPIGNIPSINKEKARQYPLATFYSMWPKAELNWINDLKGSNHHRVEFLMIGRKFFGEGRSKVEAKVNLAKAIFSNMYNVRDFPSSDIEETIENREAVLENSKFPIHQLKQLVCDDMVMDDERNKDVNGVHHYTTITIKGCTYEGFGKTKGGARLSAAKKALDVLKPKKAKIMNAYGVDVGSHPTIMFKEHFPFVEFIERETKSTNENPLFHVEAFVNRRIFKETAFSKKKAKLRVILKIFEAVKNTSVKEWTNIDVKKVFEDGKIDNITF